MTILVLGGRGKTSSRLSELLDTAKVSFVVASRSKSNSSPYKQVQFDWLDRSTYDAPFEETNNHITAIYLVAPPVQDVMTPMKEFIDLARTRGTKRFVLLSASALPVGGPTTGQVHEYLISLGVEFAVLRPTWFMENFSEQQHRTTIQKDNKVYSASEDGKIPWVSANDIAQCGYRCLVDEKSHDTDHIILGPELLSYDDNATILSEFLGRKITHVKLTVPELAARFVAGGMPQGYANVLSGLDGAIAKGSEDRLNDEVEMVTGRRPQDFRSFVKQNVGSWMT